MQRPTKLLSPSLKDLRLHLRLRFGLHWDVWLL